MRQVDNPELFLIGRPQIDTAEILRYLRKVGGEAWFRRVFHTYDASTGANAMTSVPAAEGLVEFMGRLCYRSWEPGLNKNVTRIREDRGEYLLNILRTGHGSVIEHATFNFVLNDIARFIYDELVRHRVGIAISAQSGRFVRMEEIGFRIPPFLKTATQERMRRIVEFIESEYAEMVKEEGIDELADFAQKKKITSALRRVAPHGMAWEAGWSANVRTIRHVIEMRSDAGAEEEIRIFADQLARIMQTEAPLLFGDYEPVFIDSDSAPDWTTPHRKV